MRRIAVDQILPQVSRPTRYLGNEVHAVRKDLGAVPVKVLLAFPDVYEVGMSHLGFQLLYHVLNRREDVAAERVFAPWADMESLLKEKDLPLFSLESRCPAREFDIIGFSLQYELSYATVLAMLSLAGIPLRAEERQEDHPLIIAGGPCTFNPEPAAAFFDALVIGEGEDVVEEIVDAFEEWKASNETRADLLCRLADIQGVYVPAMFTISYRNDGSIDAMHAREGQRKRVKKRAVKDLNSVYCPVRLVVPTASIVHDRINVEIARGCTRGCRFCQAGMICRPLRERSRQLVELLAEQACMHTGWEELSLLSLSSGDYSDIKGLLTSLSLRFSLHRTALSLPSLRAETLESAIVQAIQQGRKTGFTIAPEAGTERLRRVINKNLTEKDILETCYRVFSAGWKSIKLYFMIGLPTETDEDIEGIVELAEKVWAQGKGMKQKPHVAVSVSTFVPKPHTPFQWAPMLDAQQISRRQTFLRARLNRKKFRFKWHAPRMSTLEGLLARGDRKLASVIERAFQSGCRFDGWTDQFRPQQWESAFRAQGIDPQRYLKAQELDAVLPWDHIDCGVSKDYLQKEWELSHREHLTPDCRSGECNQCGACDFVALSPRTAATQGAKNITVPPRVAAVPTKRSYKIRLRFSKTGEARFLSHLETVRVFSRAARRAKIPLRFSQGFHPKPKIAFGPALPVGVESLAEYVDIQLMDRLPISEALDKLNEQLPKGLSIFSGKEISLKTPAIADSLYEMSYALVCVGPPIFDLLSAADLAKAVERFLGRSSVCIARFRKGKKTIIDIRALIRELTLSEDRVLTFTVRMDGGGRAGPTDVITGVFGEPNVELTGLSICKTRMKLKESWDRS